MQTNFARAIFRKLSDSDTTQADLAQMSGLAQSTIARLISGDRRPDVETLRTLCNCWNDPAFELTAVCEHLRDEVVRSGRLESDFVIHPKKTPKTVNFKLESNLDILRSEALEQEDVERLIADMADIVRRHRSRKALRHAAEGRSSYTTKQSRK